MLWRLPLNQYICILILCKSVVSSNDKKAVELCETIYGTFLITVGKQIYLISFII